MRRFDQTTLVDFQILIDKTKSASSPQMVLLQAMQLLERAGLVLGSWRIDFFKKRMCNIGRQLDKDKRAARWNSNRWL